MKIKILKDTEYLQIDLNNIHSWCIKNNLSLYLNNCLNISFSVPKKNPIIVHYNLNDLTVHRVNMVNDLGIYFDSK